MEPCTREADSVKEGCLDPLVPASARIASLVFLQSRVDCLARLVHRHPVEVGPGAGRGGRGVGHLVSGGLHDVDLVVGDAEGVGGHLDHLGVQPLPHLSPTVGQQH